MEDVVVVVKRNFAQTIVLARKKKIVITNIDVICLLIIYVDISLMFTKIPLKTYDTHCNLRNILLISKKFSL